MNQLTATTLTALLMGLLIAPGMAAESENVAPLRLSESSPPEVACWFWGEADFAPGGYKAMIDLMHHYISFTVLAASFRTGWREPLTDPAVFEQAKHAVACARRKGIGIAPEFSMWSDLTGFLRAYPDELYFVASLQPIQMAEGRRNEVVIASQAFSGSPRHRTTTRSPCDRSDRIAAPDGIKSGKHTNQNSLLFPFAIWAT